LKGLSFQLEPGSAFALFAPVGQRQEYVGGFDSAVLMIPESGAIRWKGTRCQATSVKTWRRSIGSKVNQKKKSSNFLLVFDNMRSLSSDTKEQERNRKSRRVPRTLESFQRACLRRNDNFVEKKGRNLSGGSASAVGNW